MKLSVWFLTVIVLGCQQSPPQAREAAEPKASIWRAPEKLAEISAKEVNESSGIASSWNQRGVYYTHNDSGDTARFFRFNEAGDVLGTYHLEGAAALDWEDMASAKLNGQSYLYFGDIGDNLERRPTIVIYRVPEPGTGGSNLSTFDTYTIKYPDGPHNAETLLVHPTTGDIYIVAKASGKPSGVFKLQAPKGSGSYTMTKLGEIKVGGELTFAQLTTGGDVSPDAKTVVIRTYLAAYEFEVGANFDEWWKATPRPFKTAAERQGEAICFSTDGKALLTTSEGSPCPVSIMRRG